MVQLFSAKIYIYMKIRADHLLSFMAQLWLGGVSRGLAGWLLHLMLLGCWFILSFFIHWIYFHFHLHVAVLLCLIAWLQSRRKVESGCCKLLTKIRITITFQIQLEYTKIHFQIWNCLVPNFVQSHILFITMQIA